MPKIIFTVTTDLNYDQRMQRICSTLAAEGYDVKLVGRKLKNSQPLQKKNFKQKRLSCFFEKGKLFYLEYNFALFFYLLFHRADIICSIDLDTILPGFIIARLKRKKFVYDAHEYFTESANLINRKFEQRIWKRVERFVVPKIKYAYTVNQSIADILEKEYGVNFGVVRNVPNHEVIEAVPLKEKCIVYQGILRGERGLHELVKSMKQVNGKLIIAGGGALLPELKKFTYDLGLDDKIEFTGQCSPQILREITRNAYIGISPLEPKGFNHLYSLSNKFLEYIQLEIPQVAMNFVEYKRVNDHYNVAILIDDTLENNFAHAINQLLNEEGLYVKLKEGTKAAKEMLNWEKEKQFLIDFYAKID